MEYEKTPTKAQCEAVRDACADLLAAIGVALANKTSLADACATVGMDEGLARRIVHAVVKDGHPSPKSPKVTISETPVISRALPAWLDAEIYRVLKDHPDPSFPPGAYDGTVPERADRVRQCLMSVPSWRDYAAFVEAYTGRKVKAFRPNRPDARSAAPSLDNVRDDALTRVDRVADFLNHPSRVRYVKTGLSDLVPNVSPDVLRLLNKCHVYVVDDLDRLTDNEILHLPVPENARLRVCSQAYRVRAASTGTDTD